MTTRTFTLQTVLKVLDRASGPLGQFGKRVNNLKQRAGLDRLAMAGSEAGVAFRKAGASLTKFAAVAGIAGGGVFAFVKKMANAGDTVAKTADKLGVGIEALQKMEHHAELSGLASGELHNSLRFLLNAAGETADGIGEAKDTFERLGISVKNSSGGLKDAETLMAEVADGIAGIEDPTRRVQVAQDLFGRSGVNMINMLKGGSKAMKAAFEEAVKLGIMTEEEARAAEKFNDNFSRLTRVANRFGQSLANHLMPHLDKFIVYLTGLWINSRPQIIEKMKEVFAALGDVVGWVGTAWRWATTSLSGFKKAILSVFPFLTAFLTPLQTAGEKIGTIRFIVFALAAVLGVKLVASVVALFAPLAKLAVAVGVVVVKMTALLIGGIKTLIPGLVSILPALSGVITACWAWTAALLANPITWVVAGVMALAGAIYALYKHWDGVVAWFKNIWGGIIEAFNLDVLLNALTSFNLSDIGLDWITGLWEGIKTGWADLMAWLGEAVGKIMDWLPDWAKGSLSFTSDGEPAAPLPTGQAHKEEDPLASSREGLAAIQFNGLMRIGFENAPPNMRVREVRTDNPNIPIDVNTGYAMAGP